VLPEEVEVRTEARTGLVVTSEGAYLAALKTDLTPELIKEGLAREFVRRVQDQRKQAGFEIADRIHLYAQASVQLAQALEVHREYIMGETLSLKFEQAAAPAGSSIAEFEFDGERVKVGLIRPV
jgi:isoleucyl-tRNA synthetase